LQLATGRLETLLVEIEEMMEGVKEGNVDENVKGNTIKNVGSWLQTLNAVYAPEGFLSLIL
jgi:hypothetical protein